MLSRSVLVHLLASSMVKEDENGTYIIKLSILMRHTPLIHEIKNNMYILDVSHQLEFGPHFSSNRLHFVSTLHKEFFNVDMPY